jgi:EAL and modified HD-GYP domain-containing signal transduction protein
VALAKRLPPRVTLLAEKVETAEAHTQATSAGCALFQGYYFCRPQTHTVKAMSPNHTTQLRIMGALVQPSVTIAAVDELRKHDPRLSYQVLRMVNSAGFGLRREVKSIREALMLMGLDPVRKRAALWALAGLNGGPSELVSMTVAGRAPARRWGPRWAQRTMGISCWDCVRSSTCWSASR